MSDDVNPGPLGIPSISALANSGILIRTTPRTPGSVGLKGGSTKGSTAPLGDQVVSFARKRIGRRVGSGECYDLADHALRNAGAKNAPDYGEITPTANYIWGQEVSLSNVRPGDIIQFRNYSFEHRVDRSDGYRTESQERPHHTAVVESVEEHGAINVLEQNAPPGSSVHRTVLYFSSTSFREGNNETTITVQGQFWFYRPEPAH